MNFGCHSFFSGLFDNETIPPGILSLPKLPNRLCCIIQPITICQERHEFDGAEKLHRVGIAEFVVSRFPKPHKFDSGKPSMRSRISAAIALVMFESQLRSIAQGKTGKIRGK
jgi:hypothetical protein